VVLTSFAASMAVNTLVTGLIVFKILKVFLYLRANMSEKTLGSMGSTGGGSRLRHILFVIIESGMALFVIQLIRIVFICLPVQSSPSTYNIVTAINQMLNVSIESDQDHIYFFFVLLITLFLPGLGHHPNNNFGAGLDEVVLR
jgi:hypothetical protein